MAAGRERRRVIQKVARVLNDFRAAHRVVFVGALAAFHFGDDVAAVERVIQTLPPRVRRVQRVARVVHRHHQLRPGDARDFVIHIFGARLKVFARRQQVADFPQEFFVGADVRHARPGAVPVVNFALQFGALFQKRAVFRPQLRGDFRQRAPKRVRLHPGSRGDFVADQGVQGRVYAESVFFDSLGHGK